MKTLNHTFKMLYLYIIKLNGKYVDNQPQNKIKSADKAGCMSAAFTYKEFSVKQDGQGEDCPDNKG